MSALFGHVRGAFTGALRDRPGLLRAAQRRRAVPRRDRRARLDEQAMLLRAIEEKRFLPVGADREVASDFQLIAGTNRDLRRTVAPRALPRGSARAHQPLDVPAARPARAARGHRAEPRLRARACRAQVDRQRACRSAARRASASSRFAALARRRSGPANFRDFNGAARAHGDAGAAAAASRRERGRRDRAPARRPGEPAPRRADARRSCSSAARRRTARRARSVRPRAARGGRSASAARRARCRTPAACCSRRRAQQERSANDADRLRKYLARFGLEWKTVRRATFAPM